MPPNRLAVKIAAAQAPFASRADDSGTHKAELKLWQQAGVNPKPSSGSWYLETGSGMGATLNTAVGKRAYALTDRGLALREAIAALARWGAEQA